MNCNNYRAIILQSTAYKLLPSVISNRSQIHGKKLEEYQGFGKGSTMISIHTLTQTSKKVMNTTEYYIYSS